MNFQSMFDHSLHPRVITVVHVTPNVKFEKLEAVIFKREKKKNNTLHHSSVCAKDHVSSLPTQWI